VGLDISELSLPEIGLFLKVWTRNVNSQTSILLSFRAAWHARLVRQRRGKNAKQSRGIFPARSALGPTNVKVRLQIVRIPHAHASRSLGTPLTQLSEGDLHSRHAYRVAEVLFLLLSKT
jgi:hypothetical protein